MDEPTRKEVEDLGWNSIDRENPTLNAAVKAQQLHYIGVLLWDIRELLKDWREE